MEETAKGAFEICPREVWLIIFTSDRLDIGDVARLGRSCQDLYQIFQNPLVWKSKFLLHWPNLESIVAQFLGRSWFDALKIRKETERKVSAALENLSKIFCYRNETNISNSAFDVFEEFCGNSDLIFNFVLDELRKILTEENLTKKYYGKAALSFLVKKEIRRNFRANQSLEKSFVQFAQWFQPEKWVNYRKIFEFLDEIAEKCRKNLKEKFPQLPLLEFPPNFVGISPNSGEILHAASIWSPEDSGNIIRVLCHVFSVEFEFRGDTESYYELRNLLIDQVISRRLGMPIVLCVLFRAVAARLGVHCECVNFPSHFLLRFLENPDLPGTEKFTYIDPFHACRIGSLQQIASNLSREAVRQSVEHPPEPPKDEEVLARMGENVFHLGSMDDGPNQPLVEPAFEWLTMVQPTDSDHKLRLAAFFLRAAKNYKEVLELMEAVEPSRRPDQFVQAARDGLHIERQEFARQLPIVMLRSENPTVTHAVGMIKRHRKYNYTCVIRGWDPVCSLSKAWQDQMGVQKLERGANQPFYHVLVEDGSSRYAADDNLVFNENPEKAGRIIVTQPDLGRFFSGFCGTHFRLNPEVAAQYPEDEIFLLDFVKKFYSS